MSACVLPPCLQGIASPVDPGTATTASDAAAAAPMGQAIYSETPYGTTGGQAGYSATGYGASGEGGYADTQRMQVGPALLRSRR